MFHQDTDISDDYGWKQIHGDVFRAPPCLILFTSLIGKSVMAEIVSRTAGLVDNYTIRMVDCYGCWVTVFQHITINYTVM